MSEQNRVAMAEAYRLGFEAGKAELKFMTAERDYLLETPDPKVAKLKEAIQAHKRSFTINGSGTKEDMELWTALEEVEK